MIGAISIVETGLGLALMLGLTLIGLLIFALWVWMLVDAITNQGLNNAERLAFVLLVFFLPFIGSLVYFFVGRPKRKLTTV